MPRYKMPSMRKLARTFLLMHLAILAWIISLEYAHAVAPIPATDSQKMNRYENKLIGRKLFAVAFSWNTPQTREDGSALSLNEINSYIIEYSLVGANIVRTVNAGKGNTYILRNLFSGTYSFRIATIDTDGQQGNFSTPINLTL